MNSPTPDPAPNSPPPAQTSADALAWAVASGAATHVIAQLASRRRSRQRRRLTVAAGLTALVALTFILSLPAPSGGAVAVGASSNLTISAPVRRELPDGSVVDLKPGAEIAVEFSPALRRVVLRAGEAHFAVAKNPARPFVVAVSGVEVRAVGTEFSVQARANAVDVLVTEGRVAVNHASEQAFVSAGELAVVTIIESTTAAAIKVAAIAVPEQGQRLAWRVPRLDFAGTPLGAVIAQFNAQTRSAGIPAPRLDLAPGLARLQVSGNLRVDDAESLLLLLKNEFGIVARPASDGTVQLARP